MFRNIASERVRMGDTQAELAARLGVSARAVNGWEADPTSIPTRQLVKLADLFGVSVDYLIGRTDKRF